MKKDIQLKVFLKFPSLNLTYTYYLPKYFISTKIFQSIFKISQSPESQLVAPFITEEIQVVQWVFPDHMSVTHRTHSIISVKSLIFKRVLIHSIVYI